MYLKLQMYKYILRKLKDRVIYFVSSCQQEINPKQSNVSFLINLELVHKFKKTKQKKLPILYIRETLRDILMENRRPYKLHIDLFPSLFLTDWSDVGLVRISMWTLNIGRRHPVNHSNEQWETYILFFFRWLNLTVSVGVFYCYWWNVLRSVLAVSIISFFALLYPTERFFFSFLPPFYLRFGCPHPIKPL